VVEEVDGGDPGHGCGCAQQEYGREAAAGEGQRHGGGDEDAACRREQRVAASARLLSLPAGLPSQPEYFARHRFNHGRRLPACAGSLRVPRYLRLLAGRAISRQGLPDAGCERTITSTR
jgi:hypothetical protein